MRCRTCLARGFTWIELLMVIAVLGLLGLIAIPGMQETAAKKQVKEAMGLADLAKRAVQSGYTASGTMPADNAAAGIPPPEKIVGNLVAAIEIEAGAITLTFGNNVTKLVDTKKLTLRPAVVNGQPVVPIAWVCHTAKVPNGMTALGRDKTDVPDKYLPLECRATE